MEAQKTTNPLNIKKEQIVKLVEAAGGVAFVSDKLNSHPLTVMRWGYRGRIPRKYLKWFMLMTNVTAEQKETLFG